MFRRAWPGIRLTLLLLLALVLIAPEWPAFGDPDYRLHTIVHYESKFDFVRWTVGALRLKAQAALAGTHTYLAGDDAREYVLAYLDDLAQARTLEAHIEYLYADPTIADPTVEAAGLQAQADTLRADLAQRQPLAEAIVQDQVATILREEGLDVAGLTWPPVFMTMSPVPTMLIVSPRDRIAQVNHAALIPGLTTEEKEAMEEAVFDDLDQSALVVPIGGLGTYPAMIAETSSINWLADVTAHEWTHHWLSFRPLGVNYLTSPELRIINETVASMVDLEIGPKVIARYYPNLVPPPAATTPPEATPPLPIFDYSAEMAETRDTVDRLLAAGEIEAAEAYMEQRRQVFVNNGYLIRKINQAFFAFYGGYAAEPGGAAGADPIGPMLRGLRAASPSLRAFLIEVGGITSYEELVERYEVVVADSGS